MDIICNLAVIIYCNVIWRSIAFKKQFQAISIKVSPTFHWSILQYYYNSHYLRHLLLTKWTYFWCPQRKEHHREMIVVRAGMPLEIYAKFISLNNKIVFWPAIKWTRHSSHTQHLLLVPVQGFKWVEIPKFISNSNDRQRITNTPERKKERKKTIYYQIMASSLSLLLLRK